MTLEFISTGVNPPGADINEKPCMCNKRTLRYANRLLLRYSTHNMMVSAIIC